MMSLIRHSAARRGIGRWSLVVAALALVACDDDPTEPGDVLGWEAELVGTGTFEDVVGVVAVVTNASSFTATIELADAPPEGVFSWTLMEGSCADPGDAVGSASSYPDLEVGDDGDAGEEADVVAALDEEGDYVVMVSDESDDDPVTVACGALQQD